MSELLARKCRPPSSGTGFPHEEFPGSHRGRPQAHSPMVRHDMASKDGAVRERTEETLAAMIANAAGDEGTEAE